MHVRPLEPRRLLSELTVSGTAATDSVRLGVARVLPAGVDVRVSNLGRRAINVKVGRTAIALAANATIRTERIKRGGVTAVRLIDLEQFAGHRSGLWSPLPVWPGEG